MIPALHGSGGVAPGDLLIVSGTTPVAELIEAGAVLAGQAAASHVAGYHHTDTSGPVPVHWGIEGRPGGVGWVDLASYLRDPRTVTTAGQPKTPGQRAALCQLGVKLLGTPYDWVGGIAADGADVLHLTMFAKALRDLSLWQPGGRPGGAPGALVPGHVVCSSAWAWAHDLIGLAAPLTPGTWEAVTPGDWASFAEAHGWERPG